LPACLCVRNFRSRRWCGDRFDDWLVGHQFEPNYLHHPVFRYRTSLGVFAFFPRNAGFRPFLVVSVSVSGERKAGFCTPVSASKIFVPRSGGDRFDDWVVGPQLEPYCLHHPVSANRTFPAGRQTGRFCGDFRPLISPILSLRALLRLSGGFWRPVSASKNSVPDGRA
jgi:hypothetical protein